MDPRSLLGIVAIVLSLFVAKTFISSHSGVRYAHYESRMSQNLPTTPHTHYPYLLDFSSLPARFQQYGMQPVAVEAQNSHVDHSVVRNHAYSPQGMFPSPHKLQDDFYMNPGRDLRRIYQGSNAPANIKALTVRIVLKYDGSTGTNLCTGTVLDRTHVLTSAHCINPITEFSGYATGAEVDLNGYKIKGKHMHIRIGYPGSSTTSQRNYDIAIISLTASLPSTTPTVVLSNSDSDLGGQGKPLTAVGWGLVNDKDLATVLQQGVVNQEVTKCDAKTGDMFFCTLPPSGTNTKICFGDSGGPVFKISGASMIQVGVNHGGNPKGDCSSTGITSIHTMVKPHLQAIQVCLRGSCDADWDEFWY